MQQKSRFSASLITHAGGKQYNTPQKKLYSFTKYISTYIILKNITEHKKTQNLSHQYNEHKLYIILYVMYALLLVVLIVKRQDIRCILHIHVYKSVIKHLLQKRTHFSLHLYFVLISTFLLPRFYFCEAHLTSLHTFTRSSCVIRCFSINTKYSYLAKRDKISPHVLCQQPPHNIHDTCIMYSVQPKSTQ